MAIDADNMPDFLAAVRDRAGFALGFARRPGDFSRWRADGHAALRAAIGPALEGEATAEIASETVFAGGPGVEGLAGATGTRLAITFPTGARTEALALLPAGVGPHPAVLLLHDHGSEFRIGKEKVIAPWDRNEDGAGDGAGAALAKTWQERFYAGVSLGHALLARGVAVVAADALGWGCRAGNGYAAQQALAANLMQLGLTLAGVVAAEDALLARWMARHHRLDPARLGVMGFSFGGFRAWQVAALCPEIRAGVAVSWMGRLGDLMRPGSNQLRGQSAFCMLHPALGGRMDYPDIAGLAAPRPMQFLAGAADAHFPAAVAARAHHDLRRIWHAAGAEDDLETAILPAGHIFSEQQQQCAFAFLGRQL